MVSCSDLCKCEYVSASRLRLNTAKTEVMWLGSGQQINQVDVSDILILSSSVKVVESARYLGVIIDTQLSLSSHAALCEFYHLRQLRPLCRSLPAEATKTLVQAFISCRLDYCNSLLYTSESSARSLRSSLESKCSVTRVHSRFGDRCFLQLDHIYGLRDKKVNCTEFRKQLKTLMFQTDCSAS